MKRNKNLSPNFSLAEATFSETASRKNIDNTKFSDEIYSNLINTANKMELVRTGLGNLPISVSSWLRVPEVNLAVKGSSTSDHQYGLAVDFICPKFGTPLQICKQLITLGISFDQLILEHTWVHISFRIPDSKNRNQVLSLLKSGKFASGLTNKYGKAYK